MMIFTRSSIKIDSVKRTEIMKLLGTYDIPARLLKAISKLYENTRARVITPDGETKGILQGDTLAPYLFAIVLDHIMKRTYNGKETELGFQLQRQKKYFFLNMASASTKYKRNPFTSSKRRKRKTQRGELTSQCQQHLTDINTGCWRDRNFDPSDGTNEKKKEFINSNKSGADMGDTSSNGNDDYDTSSHANWIVSPHISSKKIWSRRLYVGFAIHY